MRSTLDCRSLPVDRNADPAATLGYRGIVVIDRVLSEAACRRMVAEAEKGVWLPSTIAGANSKRGYRQVSGNGRDSSTLCDHHHSAAIAGCLCAVESCLESELQIKPNRLEPWQVTSYVAGQGFDFHLDCGRWARHPSGERRRSILLYLHVPERGGQTFFRVLNIRIRPVVGRLVVWNNLLPNGNCNYAMVHAGLPVTRGRKVILTTWERERRFV